MVLEGSHYNKKGAAFEGNSFGYSVVGTTRFELATTRPPDVYSTGLSYVPKIVGPTGFEPVTSTMSTWRSNQLSYGPQLTPFVTGAQRYCLNGQNSKCHEKKSPSSVRNRIGLRHQGARAGVLFFSLFGFFAGCFYQHKQHGSNQYEVNHRRNQVANLDASQHKT